MKLLQSALILFALISFTIGSQNADAKTNKSELPASSKGMSGFMPITDYASVLYKVSMNKVMSTQEELPFRILDSLANAYSYFTLNQQPFILHKGTSETTLVTIKRGFVDQTVNTSYTGTDTKDNLFILKSTDLGLTWSEKLLVYNSAQHTPRLPARYPSVYPFGDDEDLTYVFTAPLTAGEGWNGYVDGIYMGGITAHSHSNSMSIDGTQYTWSGTDSKILGAMIGTDPMGIITGELLPVGGTPAELTSNLGFRKSMTFDQWPGTVPDAWKADKFVVPTFDPTEPAMDDSLRSNNIIGLRFDSNNKMYLGIWGNFAAEAVTTKGELGFSVSEDYGQTWSEFEIMPSSLIRNYAVSLGLAEPDSASFSSNSFIVFDNGDVSFSVSFYENIDVAKKEYSQQAHHIIEIYRENGVWGIRKIADMSGLVLRYRDADGNPLESGNQMGNELQFSRTLDGTGLLAKWVDFVDFTSETDTITSAEVFMAIRAKELPNWSRAVDVTESVIHDRITWIPDYVPNDLLSVPLLKVMTIPDPNDDQTTAETKQLQLESQPQYVMIANVDIANLVGVNDTKVENPNFNIISLSPNPADNEFEFTFNVPAYGNANIDLFNAMGQKVMNAFSGAISDGIHGLTINTSNLPSGVYYCTLEFNGQKVTKCVNVVR